METAAQAVSAAPGCSSGHKHRPMVSTSTGAGVSVSVGPSQSAELPSIEQQIQFTVELRHSAMSSTHT